MRFELSVAWRYLVNRRREKFISLVGTISVLGVAVGVSALIVVLSVMAGFDNDLKEKIIGVNPHVLVENAAGMPEIDPVMDILEKTKGVVAISRFINGQVVLKAHDMSMGALMHAMEWPRHHPDVTKIRQYVVKGRLPYQDKEIVVGKELADMLDLHVGSELKVLSPVDGKSYEFTVSGIFACGMYDYDSNIVFCGIEDAQKIFVMPGAITGVGVRLTDPYMADNFARRLSKDINYMYSIRTWADLNRNLFSALKLEKLTMFIILALIVVVACFNIASTLIMMVIEKTKDIGILKSIGATNKMVNLIFTLEGLLIGLMGTVSGMVIGLGLCAFLKKYQFIQLPKEIYYIDHLPVQMQWSDAIIISASAILISLFATVYPAWQASRLNAVDALRYE